MPRVDNPVAAFCAAVLTHIQTGLPPGEFARWRAYARVRPPVFEADAALAAIDDPAQLCEQAVEVGVLPIRALDALDRMGEPVEIGEADGCAILGWPGSGVYAMQISEHETLMLWLTSPAYPPGW